MQEVQLSWQRALKIWWSLAWRGTVFAGLAGGITGFAAGAVGVPPHLAGIAGIVFAVPIGVLIGIWVVKTVLTKSYSDFRVVLVGVDS